MRLWIGCTCSHHVRVSSVWQCRTWKRGGKQGEKWLRKMTQNNCSLNVIIQSLRHLIGFRKEFKSTEDIGIVSVVTGLHSVFTYLAKSSEKFVNPFILRKALSKLDAKNFALGIMGDPCAALKDILNCLHQSSAASSCSNTKSGRQDGTSNYDRNMSENNCFLNVIIQIGEDTVKSSDKRNNALVICP